MNEAKRTLIKIVKRIGFYGCCNELEARALKQAAELVLKENDELRAKVDILTREAD